MRRRLWWVACVAVVAVIPTGPRSNAALREGAAALPQSVCAALDDRAVSALLAGQAINRRTESRPAGSRLRFNGVTTMAGREVACRWEAAHSAFVATVGQPDGLDTAQRTARAASLCTRVVSAARARSTRTRKVVTSARRHLGDSAVDIVVSGSVRERDLIYRTGSVVVELAVIALKPPAQVPSADSLASVGASLLERISLPAPGSTTVPALPATTASTSAAPTPPSTASPTATTANAAVTSTPTPTTPTPTTQPTAATAVIVTTPKGDVSLLAVELEFEDPSPGGQAVWITSRAKADVDVSCWVIGSVASGTKATIATGTHLAPGRVLRLATPTGMLRTPDTVTLTDRAGREVDRTPQLADDAADDRFWFREGETWRFGRTVYAGRVSDGRMTTVP